MDDDKQNLINPRGRAVEVDKKTVSELLKQGWVYPPEDQPNIKYSHVYDKGSEAVSPPPKTVVQVKRVIKKLGGELPVVEV